MTVFTSIFLLASFFPAFFAAPVVAFFQDAPEPPRFLDDFEKYRSDQQLHGAYSAWQNGCEIQFSLAGQPLHSGKSSLQVDILGLTPQTAQGYASIYYILPMLARNWSGAETLRFWVANSSDQPLRISFNFKEEYNEFWALSDEAVFFLESEAGVFLRQAAQYGSLEIPPAYQGFVRVPLRSFSVPAWNTAHGDQVMDLGRIESWAFGLTVAENAQRTFYLDDIAILAEAAPGDLTIEGVSRIEIPLSGEHREPFKALFWDAGSNSSQAVEPAWTMVGEHDPRIQIDGEGWLSVPAGVVPGAITLQAVHSLPAGQLVSGRTLELVAKQPRQALQPGPATPAPTLAPTLAPAESAYERYSRTFESWASERRALFVALSIAVVFGVLILLTSLHRRL